MILRWRRARRASAADINVTAFMNLMVVLTPFLLITAVFTQMSVQELNLPNPGAAADTPPPPPPLTIFVRASGMTVISGGQAHPVPASPAGLDYAALGQMLAEIKARAPGEDKVTVLLEPDIPYDTMIQVMDTARFFPDEMPLREMFPNISIGDAT